MRKALLFFLLTAGQIAISEPSLDIKTIDRGNSISDLCVNGDKIICATEYGLVEWDREHLTYKPVEFTGFIGVTEMPAVAANKNGEILAAIGTSSQIFHNGGDGWELYNDTVFDATPQCLFSDSSGSFWTGTYSNGLYCWDSEIPEIFTANTGLLNINGIVSDNQGTMWFATNEGLYSYDGAVERHYTEKDGLISDTILCLYSFGNHIWAGTASGLSCFDGDSWTSYTRQDGLVNQRVNEILVDNKDNLWVATNGGVSRFDGENWESFTDKKELMNNRVSSMAIDRESRIWFCSKYDDIGLTVYENGEFVWYTVWNEDVKLPAQAINVVESDSSGRIWVGWDGGCARLDGNSWVTYTRADGLAGENVLSMYPGGNGSMWLQFEDSREKGVSRFQDGEWRTYTIADGFAENRPNSILELADGAVWLSFSENLSIMQNGGFQDYPIKKRLLSNNVYDIDESPDGALWLGTEKGLTRFDGENWRTYTQTDGLFTSEVTSVETAPDGSVWCLGFWKYLIHFNGETFERIEEINDNRPGLFSDIEVDDSGVLWAVKNNLIAYSFHSDKYDTTRVRYPEDKVGLYSYEGASWRFHPFPDTDFWNVVNPVKVTCDTDGVIWLASETGLLRYDGDEWTVHLVNGPIGSNVFDIAVDLENVKWFVTLEGISSYDGREWRHYCPGNQNKLIKDNIVFRRVLIDPKTNIKWFLSGIPDHLIASFDGRDFTIHWPDLGALSWEIDRDGVLWRISNDSSDYMKSNIESFYAGEIKNYSPEDGLLTDKYSQLHIDRQNRKWFLSPEGLTCYDGGEFRNYIPEDVDLSGNFYDIGDDSNGTLWMQKPNGLISFDGENWKFYSDEIHGSDMLYRAMTILPDDTVWVMHEDGVSVFDGSEWSDVSGIDLEDSQVRFICNDAHGRIWLFGSNDLNLFDGEEWQYYDGVDILNFPSSRYEDMDGSLWLQSSSHVYNISLTTEDGEFPAVKQINLLGAYPNPFNEGTAIEFELGEWGYVDLAIYNILGQKVREMKNIPKPFGKSAILWNGRGDNGGRVSSGTYFYRLEKDGAHAKGRMMFVK